MLKRFLSLALVFVMVFSLLPVQALAEGISEAAVTEPAVTEPVETESEATEPEVTEPEETEPEATEPEATEPEATEPVATEPVATEPVATEPEVTEPEETEPEVTEPEVTEPEVTEPEVTEPEVTEPEETEPEVTEPEVTEPEVTEPVYVSTEETASREAKNAVISGSCGNNLTWELTDGVLTISGTGPMDDFDAATESATPAAPWDERREEITAVVIGENVTAIGNDAFWDCSNMTSIDLPDSLISIGEYAFKGCRGLTSINFPAGLTTIGKLAFSECTGLTGISLPARLTSLGDGAFFCCSGLTSIEIPSGVTVLGQTMFHNCTKLQRIYLPRTLTSIDATAFGLCSALTDVYYAGTETAWSSVSGIDSQHLASATMHYAYLCEDGHDYADGTCTNCGAENSVISGTCGDNLSWELVDGTLTISGTGAMTDFLFQTTPWYASREDITQVVIGNGVTTIGEFAFEDFSNLTDVTISNSVTSIGAYAFCYCESLKTVSIPDSVTTIGTQAFAECTALESICLPSGLTAITIALFCNCSSLKSIELPAGVTTIGEAAFDYVSQLKDVYFAGTEAAWQNISIGEDNSSLDNATMHYAYLCEDGHDYADGTCTNCGAENPVISGTCGDNLSWELVDGTLTISGTGAMTDYNSTGSIPWYGNKASITTVTISSGVTSIGSRAFHGCSALTGISIPDSVTSIGSYAFSGCAGLKKITIPESVTFISGCAFYGCTGLASIHIPASVTTISASSSSFSPFYGCSSNLVIYCAAASKPSGWDSYWNYYGSGYLTVKYGCAPDDFVFWSSLSKDITELVIPEGVTFIPDNACKNFTNLKKVYIPASVTTISAGSYSSSPFSGCSSDLVIYCGAASKPSGWYSGWNYTGSAYLTVKYGCAPDDFAFWSSLRADITELVIPEGVTSIPNDACKNLTNLKKVYIPASVTSIGSYAFDGCTGLTEISIPEGVTSIEDHTFYRCTGLKKISIPESVTSIGSDAFYNCSALTEISIPEGVTSIGSNAFDDCYSLRNIYIPESVTSIGSSAFADCYSLRNIYIPASVTTISADSYGYSPFYGCSSNLVISCGAASKPSGWGSYWNYYSNSYWLTVRYNCTPNEFNFWSSLRADITELVIPEGITFIPDSICNGFDNLKSVSIPDSVTSIGDLAFAYCDQLTDITFRHTAEDALQLGSSVFWSSSADPTPTTVRLPYAPRGIHAAITEGLSDCNRTLTWVNTETAPITAIAVTAEKDAEEMGLPVALQAEVTPYYATGDVVWTLSDGQMGEVTADGDNAVFTSRKTGTVTVRCAAADNSAVYSEVTLTILPPTEELTGLSIRVAGDIPNEIELGVPTQMVVDFQPGNAAARDVTWELDDGTGSATIDENGLVTPLTAGTVIVTATSKQDSDIFATCTVEIIRYVDDITILLDGKENVTTIGVGQQMSLAALTSPADAKYQGKDVIWALRDPSDTGYTGSYRITANNLIIRDGPGSSYNNIGSYNYGQVVQVLEARNGYFRTNLGWFNLKYAEPYNSTQNAQLQKYSNSDEVYAIKGIAPGTVVLTATSPDSRQCYARVELEVVGEELPYAVSGGNIYYNTRTGMITRADNTVTEVVIPSKIGDTAITGIGASAFMSFSTLTYVKLPDSLTFIGERAFYNCSSLATLKLGNGVTTIGAEAFYDCESISSLTIPESVTTVGKNAFMYLEGLKHLTIPGDMDARNWLDANPYYYGSSSLETVTLTGTRIIGQPDQTMSGKFLPGRNAKKIIISDSVTTIEEYAFYYSNVENLSMGSGVTSIGDYAFAYCDSLTSVTLPEHLTSIGVQAFFRCESLTSITVGDNASIGELAFSGCSSLTTVTIGDSATIGTEAFSTYTSTSSATVTIGNNASIGKEAFYNFNNLTTVTIGDGSSIGEEAFASCHNLVTVNLPDNLTHVGKGCFRECPKLQLFDMSKIPDVIIAKETPLDNMATVPTALVSATGGKVSLYWDCNLADIPENEGREPWEVARIHSDYNRKNTRLVAYGTGTIILSCTDEYTGARGSKEVRIETGIEVRGAPAYLVGGKSVKLTAYRMPDNKTEAVYWSLDTEGAKYAKLSTSNASAAVTLTANAATVTSAVQVQLTATPTGGGDEVVVSIWLLPETSDVLIFAGNPDAPADHDALNGETLDIDMHAGNTLQLSALVKPTGALNEVSWKSSAATVAAVDENGLVTLKKPGTATITATAADGSKESASVKLNVIYLDTVSKLTAAVDVPAIGLQPEESATMLVYGEDKTQPLDPQNLTFTIPASQQDIAKVENGIITAKGTAGTATVTAAITGDPLKRTVSVKVKVIPSQTASLSLTPELPANGRPVDMDEQNGSYSIGLNTRDANGQSYIFTIRPQAVNTLDKTFTPADLKWASTDSRVASVRANDDGTATVTVSANADGACAITATSNDLAKVEGQLAIYVRDYTPRLESTTLTLNTYLENGASIGLLESYDHYIDSVSIHEYDSATGTYPDTPSQRLSADYANGLLTVTASEFIKNGTIKTQLRVTCDKGQQSEQAYTFNLSVKAASTLPAITVKQPVKFNTKIGTQTALTFTAKNAEIWDVQLDEETSASFLQSDLFDEQTGTLLLDYIPGDVLDTKVEVNIYVDGYRDPIRKAVTVGTTTAMPSVTVKQPAKLNLFYTDSTADLLVTAAGAAITGITLDEESTASFEIVDSFDPDTGKLTIGLTGDYLDKLVKLDTSGKLLVELEGYTEPIAKTFTIGTVTTKPALSLTATSSIINTAISCEPSTEFAVYNKTTGENLELDAGDVSTTSNFVEISVAAENRVKLTLTGTSGGTADVSIQQATWTQPVKLSHKITVQTALPAPVLGATTLKLNSLLPDISAQTTVKLNQSNQLIESINFTPIGAEAKKIQLSYADGVITAAFDPAVDSSTLKNGTCRFSYEVTLVETNAEGNPITLPAKTLLVNVSSAAPKVSLSAKGKLDTMNPDSEVLYTVSKLTNISGYIDSVDLSGADSELFSAELDTTGSKPVVKLTMAAADQYDTGKTYKMQLVFTVRQSDDPDSPMHEVPADISFKVSQSAVKFAAVPAGKLYQFQDSVSYTVALTTPSTATLEDITLDTGKTAAAFLRAMGDGNMLVGIAPDGRSAVITFEINSPAYLTYGKSYTVYVNAEPENLSINGKPTQLKLTLKTYK